MAKKKFNKLHLFWIIPICLFGLAFLVSIFTIGSVDTCVDNEQLIANLEQGLLENCAMAKSGAMVSVMSIDLLESIGSNESSEYRPFWETIRDMDCDLVLENYKNLN